MTDFIGIDYGSKMAGTTAVCFSKKNKLHLVQSSKNKDADLFIKDLIEGLKPLKVFIDAPLSLPKGYFYQSSQEYFYRKCDREVSAMSPMFLGGLTARAVALKDELEKKGIKCFEVYPGYLARSILKLDTYQKKQANSLSSLECQLLDFLPIPLEKGLQNYHQADSVLAWLSGWRVLNEKAEVFGDENEGRIWV
ncbi:MAG: hypothetical protein AAF363_01305 [Bacteroidota bacterium]